MKKLSKITESIWSDIQDRSAGDTIRKEDDNNRNAYKEYAEMKGIKNTKHYY